MNLPRPVPRARLGDLRDAELLEFAAFVASGQQSAGSEQQRQNPNLAPHARPSREPDEARPYIGAAGTDKLGLMVVVWL